MSGTPSHDWAKHEPVPNYLISTLLGTSEEIQRALGACPALSQNVRIHHGRRDIAMAEQLLNRADIGAALEHMGGEAVPENHKRRSL